METSLLTGASAVGGEGLRLPADFLACRGPPVGCGLLLTRGHQSGLRGSPPGECEKSRRARETELELHSCTSSPPALEECFGVCLTMAVCIYHEKQTRIGTRAPWDVWRPWILGDKLLPCPLAPPKSEGTRVTGGRDTPGGGGWTRESGCPGGSYLSHASGRARSFSWFPSMEQPLPIPLTFYFSLFYFL